MSKKSNFHPCLLTGYKKTIKEVEFFGWEKLDFVATFKKNLE